MTARRPTTTAMLAALTALAAAPSYAGPGTPASPPPASDPWGLPKELVDVGIDPQPNARLPIDAVLRDEEDRVVHLGDYFTGEKPVVLVLAYFKCPMLCGMVLESTLNGLKRLAWTPGGEFDVLTISIDARETPSLARDKKASVLAALNRPGAEHGWHFLTAPEKSIAAITKAVGFKFKFLPERNDFAHAAGIFVLTPDGRVSQTITGLGLPTDDGMAYDARTLRLSIVEAGEGKVGSLLDQVLLYCFHYDPKSGKYTPVIMNIVRLAGGLTVLLLGGFVGTMLWREKRQARVAATQPSTEPTTLGAP